MCPRPTEDSGDALRLRRTSVPGRFASFLGQDENAEPQFSENHRVDGDVWLVCTKPLDDTRIGRWLGRLAQNVSINQVFHNMSVDSELTRTKNVR